MENSGTTTYGYDANGNETSVTNPNLTTVTKVYDDVGRLTSDTNKPSPTRRSPTSRDAVGQGPGRPEEGAAAR
jgi:uncharacterized protein RhaS with RHS repeats